MRALERFWHWAVNEQPRQSNDILEMAKKNLGETELAALQAAATFICERAGTDCDPEDYDHDSAARELMDADEFNWAVAHHTLPLRDLSLALDAAFARMRKQVPARFGGPADTLGAGALRMLPPDEYEKIAEDEMRLFTPGALRMLPPGAYEKIAEAPGRLMPAAARELVAKAWQDIRDGETTPENMGLQRFTWWPAEPAASLAARTTEYTHNCEHYRSRAGMSCLVCNGAISPEVASKMQHEAHATIRHTSRLPPVVHIARRGQVACGAVIFGEHVNCSHHFWVAEPAEAQANCSACKRVLAAERLEAAEAAAKKPVHIMAPAGGRALCGLELRYGGTQFCMTEYASLFPDTATCPACRLAEARRVITEPSKAS